MNEVRMIDANALKEMGATCFARRNENGKLEAIISIDNAPTIELTDLQDAYEQGYAQGWKERFGEPKHFLTDEKIERIIDLLETEWGYKGIREDVEMILRGEKK